MNDMSTHPSRPLTACLGFAEMPVESLQLAQAHPRLFARWRLAPERLIAAQRPQAGMPPGQSPLATAAAGNPAISTPLRQFCS